MELPFPVFYSLSSILFSYFPVLDGADWFLFLVARHVLSFFGHVILVLNNEFLKRLMTNV